MTRNCLSPRVAHHSCQGDSPPRPLLEVGDLLGLRIVPQDRIAHSLRRSATYPKVAFDICQAEANPGPLHGKGELQNAVGDLVAHASKNSRNPEEGVSKPDNP